MLGFIKPTTRHGGTCGIGSRPFESILDNTTNPKPTMWWWWCSGGACKEALIARARAYDKKLASARSIKHAHERRNIDATEDVWALSS
jgi:hypothetical protein